MKIGNWESAIRGLPGGNYIVEALTTIFTSVMVGYHIEHTVDDKHSVIHATGSIFERGRTLAPLGEWIAPFHVPGNFTGFGTMTWTVPVAAAQGVFYTLIGTTMLLTIDVRNTTIGGVATAAVQVKIPEGLYAVRACTGFIRLLDNGVAASGYIISAANSPLLSIFRVDGAAWTASAANTTVQGQLSFDVRTA